MAVPQVIVGADFEARGIARAMAAVARERGLPVLINEGLVMPTLSGLGAHHPGVDRPLVLLLKLDILSGDNSRVMRAHARTLKKHLEACLARGGAPIIVFCPTEEESKSDPRRRSLLSVESQFRRWLAGRGVSCVSSVQTRRLSGGLLKNQYGGGEWNRPYSTTAEAAIALLAVRALSSTLMPVKKMLVLDCDNTIWDGICGEDGPDRVRIREKDKLLQRFAARVARAGGLVCLLSRNNESDVWRVFEVQTRMPLTRDLIATGMIGWDSKVRGLVALSERFGVGFDRMVMIDDDSAECAMVSAQLPEVDVRQTPASVEGMKRLLQGLWAFDAQLRTQEDLARLPFYRTEEQRSKLLGELSCQQLVDALDIRVKMREAVPADAVRIAQLTARTTQFNCTLRVLTREDVVAALERPGWYVAVGEVNDRFGAYGTVAAAMLARSKDALDLEVLVISCRALGRGVEHMVLEWIQSFGSQHECPIVLRFKEGPRNVVAKQAQDQRSWRVERSSESVTYTWWPSMGRR